MKIWFWQQRNKIWRWRERMRQRSFHRNLIQTGNCIADSAKITYDTIFEGKNRVGENTVLKWCNIGYGSYFGVDCYFERTIIGRYCSIARNVNIIAGSHPISKFVSTHPAFFSLMVEDFFGYVHEKKYQELKFANKESNRAVVVGNDVWIGANVAIMEGITIGDGAVIAANALVTKDVAPYEIVGGIPARRMKWRFTSHQREFLLNFKWWDKPIEWVQEHADDFEDIERFEQLYGSGK